MGKIFKPKESKNLFIEALALAGFKSVEERLLAPIIGNGTLKSGIVKGAAGFIIPSFLGTNKWTRIISTAFIMDSAEDLVNVGMQYFKGAGIGIPGGSTDNWT